MDSLCFPILCIFFLLLPILCYSFIFKNQKKQSPPLPPGPTGLPILGYLPFLNQNLHFQLTDLARKHGPIYKLWLGSKLCIVINSASLIKDIARDQDVIFANHDTGVAGLAATGKFDMVNSPYGPYWRNLRKHLVGGLLSRENLEASYCLRRDEVRKAVRNVYGKMGTAINIGELIFATEMRAILCLLCDGPLEDEIREKVGRPEFKEKVEKILELFGKPNVSDFFPLLAKFDLQGIEKEMKSVLPSVHEILDYVVRKRVEMETGEDSSTSNHFVHIKAMLIDIVVGGTDTTATIVEWVMAELLQNPSEMTRVRQELTDIIGLDNIVEESYLPNLRFLEAVVKETFRLHPPVPLLIPRMPSETCTVGGYRVPEGSRVLVNVRSVSRDPTVWENPSEFNPERFVNDVDAGKWDYMGNNCNFVPFGSGRRACPGIPLAEKMVMYLLATLLHSFDWKVLEGEEVDLEDKFGIVTRKKTPLLAVPSQRLPNSDMYQ